MAYDPDADTGADTDTDTDTSDQQDRQDQYERQQYGITPVVNFRQTAPGVYSPNPAPAPAAPQATGLPSPIDILRAKRAPKMSDLDTSQAPTTYTFSAPEQPPKDTGTSFGGDLARYAMNSMRGWGQDFVGVGRFLNNQIAQSPGADDYLKSYNDALAKQSDDTLAAMSPTRRNAARASFLRTFGIGPDTDEQGNHIPSPFEDGVGGFADYAAQRIVAAGAPIVALAMLPEEGMAATAVAALAFGLSSAGGVFNTIADAVARKPDAEYRKDNEAYNALRGSGLSEQDAKAKVVSGSWASVLGAFAGGAASGVGFGKVLAPSEVAGALTRRAIGGAEGAATMGLQSASTNVGTQTGLMQTGLQKDFDTEALAREVAEGGIGGLAIGATMARKRPVQEPAPKPGVDPAAGLALRTSLPNEPAGPPVPPGHPDFTGPLPPPHGPPTAPPLQGEPGFVGPLPPPHGPPAPDQGSLDLSTTGPSAPRATGAPQGEMFPTAQEANLPTNTVATGLTEALTPTPPPVPVSSRSGGMPGAQQSELPMNQTPPVIVPTTGQGELFPSLAEANPPRPLADQVVAGETVPKTPPAAAQKAAAASKAKGKQATQPAASAESAAMTKKALVDELATTAGAPAVQDLRKMTQADLARLRDKLATPSTATPDVTTVVNGTSPPTVEPGRLGQAPPETTAPPAPGTSLPPGPEGASPETETAVAGTTPPAEPPPKGEPAPGETTPVIPGAGAAPVEQPPATAAAIRAAKRAAQKAKMTGGVAVEQAKGHVEAPTEGEREAPISREQQIATRDAALKMARSNAVDRVRDALNRATRTVITLKPGDQVRIAPVIAKAVRDLVESVGRTDGSTEAVGEAVAQFARERSGRIPGTDTSWFDIGDRIHNDLTGHSLPEREAFVRGAGEQVERQPRGVESETQKRKAETEEAGTREQDTAREEALEAGEAAPETSTGMVAEAPVTERKVQKGTDKNAQGRALIEKAIDPNDEMTALQADAKFGEQNQGRGRKRKEANKNLIALGNKMLEEATDPKVKQAIVRDITTLQTEEKLSPKQKEVVEKRLQKNEELSSPERVKELQRFIREISDPVGDAADKATEKARLRAIMDKRTGGEKPEDAPGAPLTDGIDPRSSNLIKASQDPRVDTTFMRDLRVSEDHDVPYTTGDFLRHVIQNPLINSALRPYRMLATQLRKLAPNLRMMTMDRALDEGHISQAEFDDRAGRNVYGFYDPKSNSIVVNHNAVRTTGTHVETGLHEIMHSITYNYLRHLEKANKFSPVLRALEAIRSELRDHLDSEHAAGRLSSLERVRLAGAVSNIHELHTQLMTDPVVYGFAASRVASPKLRAALAQYGYAPRSLGRSIWSGFVGWMRKALGLGTPSSASEYTMLDHLIRPMTDITERGAEYNRQNILPKDPLLHTAAAPVYDSVGATLSPRTQTILERVDPRGLGDRVRRAVLGVSNRDAIVDWNKDILPSLLRYRTSDENIRASSNEFANKYGDRVQELTGRLTKSDNRNALNNLMTDVGIHEVHVGKDLTPEQQAINARSPEAANLQRVYDGLSAKDKATYDDVKGLYRETYTDERKAQVESLLNGFMPDATPEQHEAFRSVVKSKGTLEKFLADPDNSKVAEAFGDKWPTNRQIARGMAQLHGMGFVQGDYFPLRRFGNYVVRYGDPKDPARYGVEMFESYTKANARRAELVRQGRDDVMQVAKKDDTHLADLASRPALADELATSMRSKGLDAAHIEHVTSLMNDILLRHATHSEAARARMARKGVRGASTDQARVLASDFVSKQARFGYMLHGLDRARRLAEMHDEARAHEGPTGTPGAAVRAMSVYQEMAKRTTRPEEHDNLLRKVGAVANGFSFTQSLMSPSHMLTSTLETHGNSLALLGARHGYTRTALALTRALAEASPSVAGGAKNTIKALGNRLKVSDWNLVKAVVDEMSSKPRADKVGLRMLGDELVRTGLIDHTQLQDIRQAMSPAGNVGNTAQKTWNIFYNSNAAMAHAVDVMNKLAVAKAAYDLEMRKNGGNRQLATDYAIQTARRVMPNYTIGNRERIAQGPIAGSLLQFKRYGMHMYALMANLAREAAHGPNKLESAKALAGILGTHAMMAGVLTLIADPLRYIGGAYDIATGAPSFHNYQNNARGFLADVFGRELGETIALGLPHLFGQDLHRRVGVANLLEVPEMDGFNKKGAAQVLLGLATGATGENLQNLVDGAAKFMHGDVQGFLTTAIPRVFRDAMKGVSLATQGLKDPTGKVIIPPEKIRTATAITQALGIQPTQVSETRASRNAVIEARDEQKAQKAQLSQAWVQASPTDRAAVMSQIRQFNADPHNLGARITVDQLHKDLQAARKQERAPLGLRLPAKSARTLLQAGSFANAQ